MNTSSAPTNIPRLIGLVLLYLLYFLLLSELIVRFALDNDRIFSRLETNDDSWWRLQWVKNYKTERPFELSHDIYDPILGWRTKANFIGKTGDAQLTTNAKGIRSLKDYAYDKPAGITRVLLLGDSFTFGEDVSDEEVYANLLEKALNNTEVINMAVHGYGTDQMLLSLEQEGVKYAPDIVLLGFIYEDIDRNILSFRDFAKPKYSIVDGKLTLINVPVPKPTDVLNREVYHLRVFDLATMLYDRYLWKNGKKLREAEEMTTAILREMIRTTKRIGAQPVFVYLPTARESVDESPNVRGERIFNHVCETAEVICSNLYPIFVQARRQGKSLKPYGHWDALGHELVAKGVAEFFNDEGLLPDLASDK